jgi:CBS domain-containing protein
MSIKLLRAAQLMTTDQVTIAANETLRTAAVIMNQRHVHCLLVPADEPGRCVGVITAKDIVQILCEGEAPLLDQLRVADAMTTPAVSVQQDFLIGDCIRLMRMSGVRSVPVLDGMRTVGILSFTDVLRAVALEASETPKRAAPGGAGRTRTD